MYLGDYFDKANYKHSKEAILIQILHNIKKSRFRLKFVETTVFPIINFKFQKCIFSIFITHLIIKLKGKFLL